MTRNINQLFQTIQDKGKLVTHQVTDPEIGMTHTQCSTFVNEKGLLVKGEESNPKCEQRKAMIVLFHPETGQIRGRSKVMLNV